MNLLYSKICSDGPDELAVQYNIWGCSPKMEGRLIALFSLTSPLDPVFILLGHIHSAMKCAPL